MKTIKIANKTALQIILISLILGIICSFMPSIVGNLVISLVTVIYAIIRAKTLKIELPVLRPQFRTSLLCIVLAVTAFPIAMFLNYLGICLGGSNNTNLSYSFWVAIVVIGILPAIVEEIIFRGLLQGTYMKESVVYSILFSSIYFAVIHVNISAVLYAFFYGCLFALIRVITNNLIYTMIMHSIFNVINVCFYYGNFDFSHVWEFVLLIIIGIIFCIIFGCVICYNNIYFTEQKRSLKDFITYEGVVALGICLFLIIASTIKL